MNSTRIDPDLFFDGTLLDELKHDQCYGFEPIYLLGGKEVKENMKIVNFDMQLDILTQALKKPIKVV